MKGIRNILLTGLYSGACFFLFGIITSQSEHTGYGCIIAATSLLLLRLIHSIPERIRVRIDAILNPKTFFDK